MTAYNTDVSLMSFTTGDPEALIEFSGRLCANSTPSMGTDNKWIQKRVAQGHESIIEHASATFIIVCSRAVTHELVRHRIASYSQRSQRYAREDGMVYFTPPELEENLAFHQLMEDIFREYKVMLGRGIKPEIARYILPNAWRTEIVMTMNFRELRHFIKLSTSPNALPEM
jgi:thymidylate synthase (FAD)